MTTIRASTRAVLMTAVLLTGCGDATYRWRPSLVTQVPDSTPVRFSPPTPDVHRRAPYVKGRSFDWERGHPSLITATGDTVLVPDGARMEVKVKSRKTRAPLGAVVGFVVGVGVSYALCPEPRTSCGEEDPLPIWSAGLGALVGALLKTDDWVRVSAGQTR